MSVINEIGEILYYPRPIVPWNGSLIVNRMINSNFDGHG